MKRPIYIFLLPVFFVFHGYVENFRAMHFLDCLPLIAIYWGVTSVFLLIFYFLLKDQHKAAIMTLAIMSFYFFFGALHDFLVQHNIFLHRYSLLLPLFLAGCILLYLGLRRKRSFTRLCLFLNSLLLIYLLVDGITLVSAHQAGPNTRLSSSGIAYKPCNDCPKPDIYLLLFDEYSNSSVLKNVYGYDNSALDSFLAREGFYLETNSRSNYQMTVFSMASMLNMAYLHIRDTNNVGMPDFEEVMSPHRKEGAIDLLSSMGYTIVNNSAFDLPDHPTSFDQPYILTRTRLITSRTLIDYMIKDIGFTLKSWILQNKAAVMEDEYSRVRKINETMFLKTLETSVRTSDTPRFIYMHVFLPHAPHMYDSLFHPLHYKEIARNENQEQIRLYLNYIPYTNKKIREIVTAIKKNTDGKAVIIFMSDHGMRYTRPGEERNPYCFNNQAAIYFPDRDYRMLNDSLTAVNQFRVLFNKLFQQQLPLLKDSTFYLDKNTDAPSE